MHFARVYYSPKGSPTQVEAGDLYFARGRPLLVFSWKRRDGERVPEECIELDPAKLQRASSNGTIYRYEGALQQGTTTKKQRSSPHDKASTGNLWT